MENGDGPKSPRIQTHVMDSMDAQADLSKKALNSEVILDGLKAIMLNQLGLYEELKKGFCLVVDLSMQLAN